jgi:hypothetical protein
MILANYSVYRGCVSSNALIATLYAGTICAVAGGKVHIRVLQRYEWDVMRQ